jgi:threonine/homoserine/homoserine lactone efflux protein
MDTLWLFFFSAVLLALAPGPDNLFVLAQSALQGFRAGIVITLGLCTGLIGHSLLVATGGAAVLHGSPLAFTALKWLGAGYLLFLAWLAFTAPLPQAAATVTRGELWQLYRRGILMNLSNPKVAIFFLAFLPQFANPDGGAMFWQLLGLGALFMLAALFVFGVISLLADKLSHKMTPPWQRFLQCASGVVFVALALKLAFF